MSNKLSIKRIGTVVPGICLVVFLLFCIAATWLATAGLPRSIVDRVEAAAAAEGIPLKIEKIKLNIFKGAGVEAEGIRVFATEEDEEPIIVADSAVATVSAAKLFIGKIEPKTFSLLKGRISIPISDTNGKHELTATDINIEANFRKQFVSLRTTGLKLQGIPINIKALLDIDALMGGESAEEEHEKLVIPAILKTCQSIVDRTYHQIEEQHWAPNEYPELHINIAVGNEVHLKVEAEAPKYDIADFNFRDAKLSLDYQDDRVIINNLAFRTVKPESHVQLQGGYELETRKLNLTLESDAALLEMAKELADGELLQQLQKFSHEKENAPHIKLNVNAIFGEDFSLHSAVLDGELEQKELHVGSSVIDHLFISFFYNNGNFNINNLTLQLGGGSISAQAISTNGTGTAELEADLPIIHTISLINEFCESPIVIPAGIKVGNNIKLKAKATLSMPEFKAGNSYEQHFVPEVKDVHLSLALEQLAFMGYKLKSPTLTFTTRKAAGETANLLQRAQLVTLNIQASEAEAELSPKQSVYLATPGLHLKFNGFDRNTETNDITLGSADLDFTGTAVEFSGLTTGEYKIAAKLDNMEYGQEGLNIDGASLCMQFEKLVKEQLSINSIEITASTQELQAGMPDNATLNASIAGLFYQGKEMGNTTASVHIPKGEKGKIDLHFTPAACSGEKKATITANADISENSILNFTDLQAYLPCSNLEHVLEAFNIEIKEIEMPHDVTLAGELSLDMRAKKLNKAQVKVQVPELIRTPHKIKAFKGKKHSLDITATVYATGAADRAMEYNGDVSVTHATGNLQAKVEGNTAKYLHVTGKNTIRPDVVDELMDYSDAHEIIRDFKFNNQSKSVIDNIVVDVRYDNGLDVAVDCDVLLNNMQYQLSAIIEDDEGNEQIDKNLGKLPFTSVNKATTHLRVDYEEDIVKDGKKQATVIDIVMTDVMLNYNNTPWLTLQNYSKLVPGLKGQRSSELRGDKVLIDIENGAVALTNVKGSVYAAYSLGMFYSDLREYLGILITPYPTQISTDYCQFPIYSDSKEDMKGHIQVSSNKLTYLDFLGTQIPLTRLTGFIGLHNDYIYLDRMNARCWDGTVNAAVKIGISDKSPAFDGQVTAKNMDLEKIAASYDAELDSALCEADIRFRASTSDLKDIQAYGSARIVNGNLMALSIFQPIGAFVSDITGNMKELDASAKKQQTDNVLTKLTKTTGATINAIGSSLDKTAQYIPGYNHVFAYDLQNAFVNFVIEKGHFRTTSFKALGYNLKVTGLVDINLDNMEIYGNMWPQVSSLPTLLLSPITFVSDFMLDIVIYGKIDDLKWKFRLDPRLSPDSPKTAQSSINSECPAEPKKQAKSKLAQN